MEAQSPTTYRECSVPRPPEAVQADWEAFCEAVYSLRVKHRIPDLYMVARMVLQYERDEGQAMICAHFGDELQAEQMVAWALGHEQSCRQERIARVLRDATKAIRHGENRQ